LTALWLFCGKPSSKLEICEFSSFYCPIDYITNTVQFTRKDKTNVFLYQHVFDFCYEKRPMDARGVLASVMLALSAKDLSIQEKLWFAKKKLSFLTEHGNLQEVRESRKECQKHQALLDQHLKVCLNSSNGELG